jgi:hypothetical protein
MIYLEKDDLYVIIKDYTLLDLLELTETQLLNTGSTILDKAEMTAVDIVFSYIGNIYDYDTEIVKTGVTRNYMIVNAVSTILQHLLYQRVSSNVIPNHIDTSYTRTIENLVNIQNRKIVPQRLEHKLSGDTSYVPRLISDSNSKTTYDY